MPAKPATFTLTAEADSAEKLEKLIEQALFEVRTASMDKLMQKFVFSESCKGGQSGTMGTYSFAYERAEKDESEKNEFF